MRPRSKLIAAFVEHYNHLWLDHTVVISSEARVKTDGFTKLCDQLARDVHCEHIDIATRLSNTLIRWSFSVSTPCI